MGTGTAPPRPSPSSSTLCYFVTSQLPGCARCSISLRFRCPYTRTLVVARPHSLAFIHPKSASECSHSSDAQAHDFCRHKGRVQDGDVDMDMNEGSASASGSRQNGASPSLGVGDHTPERHQGRADAVKGEEECEFGEEFPASWALGEAFNPITVPLYADVFCMAAFPRVGDTSRSSDASVCGENGVGHKHVNGEPAELEDLLVLTDRQILLLLRYDEEKGTVVTVESIDLKEIGTRFVDGGPLMAVCPMTRCIMVYQYESLLQYIPFNAAACSHSLASLPGSSSETRGASAESTHGRGEPRPSLFLGVRLFRLDEQNILDLCFLPPPEMCMLSTSDAAETVPTRTEAAPSQPSWMLRGNDGFMSARPFSAEESRWASDKASVGVRSAHLCVLYETAVGVISSSSGSLHRFQRFVRAVRLPLDDLAPARSVAPNMWTSPYLLHPLRVKGCSSRLYAPAYTPAFAASDGEEGSRPRRRTGSRGERQQDTEEAHAPSLLVLGAEEVLYMRFPHYAHLPSILPTDLGAMRDTGGFPGPVVLRHRGLPPGLQEIVVVEEVRGDHEEPDALQRRRDGRKVFLLGDVAGQLYMLILFETIRRAPRAGPERRKNLQDSSVDKSWFAADETPPRTTARMCVEWLGQASEPTGLSYLGDGVLFVASATSDSLLLRILDVGRSVKGVHPRLFSGSSSGGCVEAGAHLSLRLAGARRGAKGERQSEEDRADAAMVAEEEFGNDSDGPAGRSFELGPTVRRRFEGADERNPLGSTQRMDISGRLQLLQVFPNLGPIIDCCLAEVEGVGQQMLIVACGHGRSASLRFIRSGLAVHPSCASVPLFAPVLRLWTIDLSPYALAPAGDREPPSRLADTETEDAHSQKADRGPLAVLAFPHETRILAWRLQTRNEEGSPSARKGSDLPSRLDVEMEESSAVSSSLAAERPRGRGKASDTESQFTEAVLDELGVSEATVTTVENVEDGVSSFGFKRDETTLLAATLRLPGKPQRARTNDCHVASQPACTEACACSPVLVQVLPSSVRLIDPVSLSLLGAFPLFSGALSPALTSSQSVHFASLVAVPCSGDLQGGARGDALALALSDGSVACVGFFENPATDSPKNASDLAETKNDSPTAGVTSAEPASAAGRAQLRVLGVKQVCEEIAAFNAASLHALVPMACQTEEETPNSEATEPPPLSEAGDEGLAAVGDFDLGKVRLLAVPSLQELASFNAHGDEIGVRLTSLLLCTLENMSWVLAGLSDGRLVSHALEVSLAGPAKKASLSPPPRFSVRLAHRRVVHMGSEPLHLSALVEKRDLLRMQRRRQRMLRARSGRGRDSRAPTATSEPQSAQGRDESREPRRVKEGRANEDSCLCWRVKTMESRSLAGVFCSGDRPALLHATKTGHLQVKAVPSSGVGALAEFSSPFTDPEVGVLWTHIPSGHSSLSLPSSSSALPSVALEADREREKTAPCMHLFVGVRERARRLQVRGLPIGRTVDALCVLPEQNLIVLACPREIVHPDGVVLPSCLLFVDPLSCVVEGCYVLPSAHHIAASLCVASFNSSHPALSSSATNVPRSCKEASARGPGTGGEERQSLLCVGTAEVLASDSEPKEGLIILLDVHRGADRRLVVQLAAHIHELRSGVQQLRPFQGLLLAACNHRVRLFGLRRELDTPASLEAEMDGDGLDGPADASAASGDKAPQGAGRRQVRRRDKTEEKGRELAQMLKAHLELVCSHSSNAYVSSMDTWHDEIVCLGDMVASAVLLRFSPKDKAFKEIARDTNACWTLAVSCLTPDLHYLADADRNVWLLQRASLRAPAENRREESAASTRFLSLAPDAAEEECAICHGTPASGGCMCSGICVRMSGVSYIHVGVSINKIISFPTHEHHVPALAPQAPSRLTNGNCAKEREKHEKGNGERSEHGETARRRGRVGVGSGAGRDEEREGANEGERRGARLGDARKGKRGVPGENGIVVGENSKLWVSAEGALGHLLQLRDEQTFARLAVLQDAVTKVTKNIGKLSTVAFHSVKVGTATVPSKGFIDGDILERFLDFPSSVQRSVYEMAQLNSRIAHLTLPPFEKVVQEIEELQRRH